MKTKTLITVILLSPLLLILNGCNEILFKEYKNIEASTRERVRVLYGNLGTSMSIYPFEYNGHKYLEIDMEKHINVIHDPDCSCSKSKKEDILNIEY